MTEQQFKLNIFREEIMEELFLANTPNQYNKDILIVVHDQLSYTKKCIESIIDNTQNYKIYVWDNASKKETSEYLRNLFDQKKIHYLHREETNIGFIKPNNRLFEKSSSPFVVLLNSDCEVRKGWDLAMVNFLSNHQDYAQVGYCGSKLEQDGTGKEAVFGDEPDFICGWCMCLRRSVCKEYLFDEENLEFAYAEDSDLSLRLKEQGWKIYSLHNDLVIHYANKTIEEVHFEKGDSLNESFKRNHAYIRKRWEKYLTKDKNGGSKKEGDFL